MAASQDTRSASDKSGQHGTRGSVLRNVRLNASSEQLETWLLSEVKAIDQRLYAWRVPGDAIADVSWEAEWRILLVPKGNGLQQRELADPSLIRLITPEPGNPQDADEIKLAATYRARQPVEAEHGSDRHLEVQVGCYDPAWYAVARELLHRSEERFQGITEIEQSLSGPQASASALHCWTMELRVDWAAFLKWLQQICTADFAWYETPLVGYADVRLEPKDSGLYRLGCKSVSFNPRDRHSWHSFPHTDLLTLMTFQRVTPEGDSAADSLLTIDARCVERDLLAAFLRLVGATRIEFGDVRETDQGESMLKFADEVRQRLPFETSSPHRTPNDDTTSKELWQPLQRELWVPTDPFTLYDMLTHAFLGRETIVCRAGNRLVVQASRLLLWLAGGQPYSTVDEQYASIVELTLHKEPTGLRVSATVLRNDATARDALRFIENEMIERLGATELTNHRDGATDMKASSSLQPTGHLECGATHAGARSTSKATSKPEHGDQLMPSPKAGQAGLQHDGCEASEGGPTGEAEAVNSEMEALGSASPISSASEEISSLDVTDALPTQRSEELSRACSHTTLTSGISSTGDPWDVIPDDRDREMVRLLHEGLSHAEIERRLEQDRRFRGRRGVSTKTITNRLSELRKEHGADVVPYRRAPKQPS